MKIIYVVYFSQESLIKVQQKIKQIFPQMEEQKDGNYKWHDFIFTLQLVDQSQLQQLPNLSIGFEDQDVNEDQRCKLKQLNVQILNQQENIDQLRFKYLHTELESIVQKILLINVEQYLKQQQMIPIKLDVKQIRENVNRYFDKDYAFSNVITQYENAIANLNNFSYKLIMKNIQAFWHLLKIPEKQSFKTIQQIIEVNTQSTLKQLKQQDQIAPLANYGQNLMQFQDQLIDTIIKTLCNYLTYFQINKLQTDEFIKQECFHHLFQAQLAKITLLIKDFKDDNKLFNLIKEQIYDYQFNIEQCLNEQSQLTISKMKYLEDLLKKYPSLANVESYKLLQKETAYKIWNQMDQNLEKYYFLREEFYNYKDVLRQQIIGNFYDYCNQTDLHYSLPFKPLNQHFQSTSLDILLISHPSISSDIYIKIDNQDDLLHQNILLNNSIYSNYTDLLQFQVQKYQSYQNQHQSDRTMVVVQLLNYNSNGNIFLIHILVSTFGIQIINSILHFIFINQINFHDWYPISSIQFIDDCKCIQFLQMNLIIKPNQHTQSTEDSQKQHSSQEKQKIQLLQKGDLSQFQKREYYQIIPQDQLTIGNASQLTMTSGCIGAGLGCLILDSMDDSIPWEDKLKRAGQTTVTSGVLTGIFVTMPALSAIIIQVYVVYMVKKTFSNEVINSGQKMKQLGHLGVQTSVGVGSAIAGQMLIPIPILGAIIGSAVGGVAVGLYQRIVIPNTKASIMKMLRKLEQYKSENGQIFYNDEIIKILKISNKHFHKNKPEQLSESDWLSLIVLHLTNEVFYLSFLENQNKNLKLREKYDQGQENKEIEQELEKIGKQFLEIEENKKVWEVVQKYIAEKEISSLQFAESIGKFVDGMISNFKI